MDKPTTCPHCGGTEVQQITVMWHCASCDRRFKPNKDSRQSKKAENARSWRDRTGKTGNETRTPESRKRHNKAASERRRKLRAERRAAMDQFRAETNASPGESPE